MRPFARLDSRQRSILRLLELLGGLWGRLSASVVVVHVH